MSDFITSVEKIVHAHDAYLAESDLSLGQDWEKCVPFATWQRTSCAPNAAADNGGINCVEFEMYNNGGTAAIRSRVGYTTGSHAKSICAYVVEYGADVLVDQYDVECNDGGTFDIDLNQAITDVDKTFCVFYNMRTGGGWGNYDENCVSARILSATGGAGGVGQVRLEKGSGASYDCDGRLYVVEDIGSNFDVYHGDSALTQGVLYDDIIPFVDMDHSFLVASYHTTQPDDDPNTGTVVVHLLDSTHVRAFRNTGGEAVYVKYQVVTLAAGNVYRGLVSFPANDDQETDGPFAVVDEAVSMAWSPGFANGQAGDVPGTSGNDVCGTFVRIQIDGAATGVVLDRLDYGDEVATAAWEVVEWEAGGAPQKYVTEESTTAVGTDKEITKDAVVAEESTTAVGTDKSITKETSVEGSTTTGISTDKTVTRGRPAEGTATTGVSTEKTITKDAVVEKSATTAVGTDKVVTKTVSVEGSATTGISTDKEITKDAVVEESATTAVGTDKTVVVAKTAAGEATTGVSTDKEITKTAVVAEESTTAIGTDKAVTKETDVEGEATTAVSTDYDVTTAKSVAGEATTAVSTDKTITRDRPAEGSATTAVGTDKTITKVASVEGSATTGVTTEQITSKDKEAEGEATTAVGTDKSLTKETLITESSTTGVITDKSVTKETSVEGSATTGISTDKDVVVAKTAAGEATTGVNTDKEITKDAVVEGSATTGVGTDKTVERFGEKYVSESATTSVQTDKKITAIKYVSGFATTGVGTDFATPKEAVVAGAATTGVLTSKSFTKVTNVSGITTTAVTTDKEVDIGAKGPFPVTIHEVYAKTRIAEVLSKTSIGEVRFRT